MNSSALESRRDHGLEITTLLSIYITYFDLTVSDSSSIDTYFLNVLINAMN